MTSLHHNPTTVAQAPIPGVYAHRMFLTRLHFNGGGVLTFYCPVENCENKVNTASCVGSYEDIHDLYNSILDCGYKTYSEFIEDLPWFQMRWSEADAQNIPLDR